MMRLETELQRGRHRRSQPNRPSDQLASEAIHIGDGRMTRSDERRHLLPTTPVIAPGSLRIVFPIEPGPIRTIHTGSKVVATRSYISGRFDESHPLECQTEFRLARHNEVTAGIRDAVPQPCRIEAVVDGIRRIHIPDGSRLWFDGRRELIDVKRDASDLRDAGGVMQRLLGSAAAAALGWDYVMITLAALGDQDLNDNVDLVQSHRFTSVTTRQRADAAAAVAKGTLSLGALMNLLCEDRRNGLAAACALMVRHVVAIDLDRPIGPASIVTAAPVALTRLPSIRL